MRPDTRDAAFKPERQISDDFNPRHWDTSAVSSTGTLTGPNAARCHKGCAPAVIPTRRWEGLSPGLLQNTDNGQTHNPWCSVPFHGLLCRCAMAFQLSFLSKSLETCRFQGGLPFCDWAHSLCKAGEDGVPARYEKATWPFNLHSQVRGYF